MKILSRSALERIAAIQDESVNRLEKLLTQQGYESGVKRMRVEKNLAKTKTFQSAARNLVKLAMASGRMPNVMLTQTERELIAIYADFADSEV